MTDKRRVIGIDILKIIAAIMIVALHYLGYSNNLMAETAQTRELFLVANLMEAFCICGVNVFVICTCYFNVRNNKTSIRYGISKAVSVWAQTALITIPAAIVFLMTGLVELNFAMIRCILPFFGKAYWFVATFICFTLLLPFLNQCVVALSDRSLTCLSLLLVSIYSVIPTFLEIFNWEEPQYGYSLVWFVTLYCCTAWMLRKKLFERIPRWFSGTGYVACSLVIFVSVVVIEKMGGIFSGYENYIIRNYASLPIFLQAFCLFSFFVNTKPQKNEKATKVISVLASGSLMSYIIHMHPALKQLYEKVAIHELYPQSILLFAVFCFVVSIGVFLAGVLVYCILKMPIRKLSSWIMKWIDIVINKFEKFQIP